GWRHGRHSGHFHPRCCLGLERENPVPHAWQDWQASSVLTFGGPTRPKKPAPSLLQAASPVERGVRRFRLRLPVIRSKEGVSPPWRLSGLLSGCLPTDTRPQARANLGNLRNNPRLGFLQELFALRGKKLWQRFFKTL